MAEDLKTYGHRRKGGTHGALSKAGKMRSLNPINWEDRKDKRLHPKKHKNPRTANRNKYKKRIILEKSGNSNE